MLRFRSEPIRLVTTFLKIVPLLTGYISETQTLDAKMNDFVEGDVPTSCLKVTLEQRAEYLLAVLVAKTIFRHRDESSAVGLRYMF